MMYVIQKSDLYTEILSTSEVVEAAILTRQDNFFLVAEDRSLIKMTTSEFPY